MACGQQYWLSQDKSRRFFAAMQTCTYNSQYTGAPCGAPASDYRTPTMGNGPAFACATHRHAMSLPTAEWRSLAHASPAQRRNWALAIKRHATMARRRTRMSKVTEAKSGGPRCECEHKSHFADDDDFRGHEGHQYGRADSEVVPIKTAYGTFRICTDCQQAGHMLKESVADALIEAAMAGEDIEPLLEAATRN